MNYRTIITALLVCLNIHQGLSQVTIGNNEFPMPGALLQLKNIDGITDDSANSTKGLMLPRVQLISPVELYPMFEIGDPNYTIDKKKDLIGLCVYVPSLWSDNYCPGLYVWDGESWESLFGQTKLKKSSFTDGEGNTYEYVTIGGVDWSQNIMTTREGGEPTGQLLSKLDPSFSTFKLAINTADNFKNGVPFLFETKQEIIDKGSQSYKMNGDIINTTMLEFASKFGILYTYYQAQKACPTGWTLPNKQDFETMYQNIQSHFGISAEDAATSMKSDRSVYETMNDGNSETWYGVNICDTKAVNSGFNALPSGAVHGSDQPVQVLATDFGAFTFWWFDQGMTSLNSLKRYSLGRQSSILTLESSTGGSITPGPRMGYSVRCIRK